MCARDAGCKGAMRAECKKRLRDDFSEKRGLTCNFEKNGDLNAILQSAGFKMQSFRVAMHQDRF